MERRLRQPAHDIVVIGDLTLDWLTRDQIPLPFTGLQTSGIVVKSQIDELPGGTGLTFADFAKQAGYSPVLFGSVGSDNAGTFLIRWLQQENIDARVVIDDVKATGRVIIIYDPHKIRLMVVNSPNATNSLSTSFIQEHAHLIKTCKILYVSGYCVMDELAPRTAATLEAMRIAAEANSTVVFDLVPHHLSRDYPLEKFLALTKYVDIPISEVPTVRRLLRLGTQYEVMSREVVLETVEQFTAYFSRFILRYGPTGTEHQVIHDAKRRDLVWEDTVGFPRSGDRGLGDWLTIRTLKELYKIGPLA